MIDLQVRSGDALFAWDEDMRIVHWNAEAERMTGISSEQAVGRRCWDVLHGLDENGAVICHPGCSGARLAREGWPVPCRRMSIRTKEGRKTVYASTVALRLPGQAPLVVQLLRNGDETPDESAVSDTTLTKRQREVLSLLADGVTAKVVARRLGITEITVRNHIAAVLRALGCHSQLEAVAEARRRGLVG
jgi:PAS domain S-box-containing protein